MKNILLAALLVTGIVSAAVAAQTPMSASYASELGNFNSFGESAGTTYTAASSLGKTVEAGSPSSLNYKSYDGPMPAFVVIIDVIINFIDADPAWEKHSPVKSPKLTAAVSGDSNLETVWFRVSTSGLNNFGDWVPASFVSLAPQMPGKYKMSIPIPQSTSQSFGAASNNYIQWKVRTARGVERDSDPMRITVQEYEGLVITIIQPDEKSGYASLTPLVKASIEKKSWEIDPASIEVSIERSGQNVSTVRSADDPAIYNDPNKLVLYKYDQPPLQPDTEYVLKVSAKDMSGRPDAESRVTKSVTFIAKGGAIADLVPYPSPFDPKVQPLKIRYVLDKPSNVTVNMYDMSGRIVKNIINGEARDAGISEELWSGDNYAGETLANGVYFCEVIAKNDDGEHRRYTSLAIFGK